MNRSIWMPIVALGLAACSAQQVGVTVSDAWSRPAAQGGVGAVYFVVENADSANDALVGAATDIAGTTELHMSMMSADGVMSMDPMDRVPVPAGESVTFEPGGLHVMLVDLRQELSAGDSFIVTLEFENGASVEVDVSVRAQ